MIVTPGGKLFGAQDPAYRPSLALFFHIKHLSPLYPQMGVAQNSGL